MALPTELFLVPPMATDNAVLSELSSLCGFPRSSCPKPLAPTQYANNNVNHPDSPLSPQIWHLHMASRASYSRIGWRFGKHVCFCDGFSRESFIYGLPRFCLLSRPMGCLYGVWLFGFTVSDVVHLRLKYVRMFSTCIYMVNECVFFGVRWYVVHTCWSSVL